MSDAASDASIVDVVRAPDVDVQPPADSLVPACELPGCVSPVDPDSASPGQSDGSDCPPPPPSDAPPPGLSVQAPPPPPLEDPPEMLAGVP
eukprot:24570-Pyramimonas_sp.AAC.1